MAVTNPTYTITHEDGSAVTPQEFYDAFMSGTVILEMHGVEPLTITLVVTGLGYEGTPSNVTYCAFKGPNDATITLGE